MLTIAFGATGIFNKIKSSFVPIDRSVRQDSTFLLGLEYNCEETWKNNINEGKNIDSQNYSDDYLDDTDIERERIREYLYCCCQDIGVKYPEGLYNLKDTIHWKKIQKKLFDTIEEFLMEGTYDGNYLVDIERTGSYRILELYKPKMFNGDGEELSIPYISHLYKLMLKDFVKRFYFATKETKGNKYIELPNRLKRLYNTTSIHEKNSFIDSGYALITPPKGYRDNGTFSMLIDDKEFIDDFLETILAYKHKDSYFVQSQSPFFGCPYQSIGVSEFVFLADIVGEYIVSQMYGKSEIEKIYSLRNINLYNSSHNVLDVSSYFAPLLKNSSLVNIYGEEGQYLSNSIKFYLNNDYYNCYYCLLQLDNSIIDLREYLQCTWKKELEKIFLSMCTIDGLTVSLYKAVDSINSKDLDFTFEKTVYFLDQCIISVMSRDYLSRSEDEISSLSICVKSITNFYKNVINACSNKTSYCSDAFNELLWERYNFFDALFDRSPAIQRNILQCKRLLNARDDRKLIIAATNGLTALDIESMYVECEDEDRILRPIEGYFEFMSIVAKALEGNKNLNEKFEELLTTCIPEKYILYYWLMYCIEQKDHNTFAKYINVYLGVHDKALLKPYFIFDLIKKFNTGNTELSIDYYQFLITIKGLYILYPEYISREDWDNICRFIKNNLITDIKDPNIKMLVFKYLGLLALRFGDIDKAKIFAKNILIIDTKTIDYEYNKKYSFDCLFQYLQVKEHIGNIEDIDRLYNTLYKQLKETRKGMKDINNDVKKVIASTYRYIDN